MHILTWFRRLRCAPAVRRGQLDDVAAPAADYHGAFALGYLAVYVGSGADGLRGPQDSPGGDVGYVDAGSSF